MSPTLTFSTNSLPNWLDTFPLLRYNTHMKHALIWIIETFYSDQIDEIWDDENRWQEIFDRHIDEYVLHMEYEMQETAIPSSLGAQPN